MEVKSKIHLIGSVFICCLFALSTSAQVKMHVINVGQAESILFEFPKHALLVDAGGEETFEVEEQNRYRFHLLDYLDRFFARRIDLNNTIHSVIVSHPHKDHTKNLAEIFKRFEVDHFIEGGGGSGSGISEIKSVRKTVMEKGIKYHKIKASDVKKNDFMGEWQSELKNNSEVEIKFLSGQRVCNDENNESITLRVSYRGKSFLLIGDAEVNDEEYENPANQGCGGLIYRLLNPLVGFPDLLDVDVLKIGHHGSHNGTSEQLLAKVTPQIAVISAGLTTTRSNGEGKKYHAWKFGHPNQAAITLLNQYVIGSRQPKKVKIMTAPRKVVNNYQISKAIYCTSWDGDIIVTITPNGQLETTTLN